MAPTPGVIHLPNGQTLTVVPVFGGFFFKPSDLNIHHNSAFPAGWTVILQTEDYDVELDPSKHSNNGELSGGSIEQHHHIHPFRNPTLHNDYLFISSISNPSSSNFKAPISPTRQIAMMLWATLYWYFHRPEPSPYLTTEALKNTPDEGKPKGDWRINIKREGVFRGRNLIQKLERMGLICSEDASVGVNPAENTPEGWSEMFVSRQMYWQLSGKLFLFTLTPSVMSSFPGSPFPSRPTSPVPGSDRNRSPHKRKSSEALTVTSPGLWSPASSNPFTSGSHLPTYIPPPPLQYTMTSGVHHPRRPKPPRQGEVFYTRFIPSIGQYLSFRVASLSPNPVAYHGPKSTSHNPPKYTPASSLSPIPQLSPSPFPNTDDVSKPPTDIHLLNCWMNNPRVSKFWGEQGPQSKQENFLLTNLSNNHSFPSIGLWDGKPFGYFELYWAKEDILGKKLGDRIGDFDRGIHALVGEEEFRGRRRVMCWLSSLVHWTFLQDYRTMAVVLEPRVDNERFITYLAELGFAKEGEVTFPHKQSAFMRIKRENFEAPTL